MLGFNPESPRSLGRQLETIKVGPSSNCPKTLNNMIMTVLEFWPYSRPILSGENLPQQ